MLADLPGEDDVGAGNGLAVGPFDALAQGDVDLHALLALGQIDDADLAVLQARHFGAEHADLGPFSVECHEGPARGAENDRFRQHRIEHRMQRGRVLRGADHQIVLGLSRLGLENDGGHQRQCGG